MTILIDDLQEIFRAAKDSTDGPQRDDWQLGYAAACRELRDRVIARVATERVESDNLLIDARPFVASWAEMTIARTNHDKTLKSKARSLLSKIDIARAKLELSSTPSL